MPFQIDGAKVVTDTGKTIAECPDEACAKDIAVALQHYVAAIPWRLGEANRQHQMRTLLIIQTELLRAVHGALLTGQPIDPEGAIPAIEGTLATARDFDIDPARATFQRPIVNQEGATVGTAQATLGAGDGVGSVAAFVDDKERLWLPPTAWAYMAACQAIDLHRNHATALTDALTQAGDVLAEILDHFEKGSPKPRRSTIVDTTRRARDTVAFVIGGEVHGQG